MEYSKEPQNSTKWLEENPLMLYVYKKRTQEKE